MDKAQKDKILDELGGIDEADYDALVLEFIALAEKQVMDITTLIRENNFDGISRTAHTLKGSAGNLRIYKIQETAKIVEAAAYEKKDIKEIEIVLQKLARELEEFKKE